MTDASPVEPAAALALHRLRDPEDAARLVGLIFDFFAAQPLHRFVTPGQVLAHLEAALQPAQVRRALDEHVLPALDRDAARAHADPTPLKDYLTPEARELARRLAGAPVRLEPAFFEGLVKQEAVLHLVRVMVEETLGRFVQMLKPAAAAGPLGKGLFARLGAQMESQLSRAAAGFVSTSLDFLTGRLAQVLATPETRQQLGRLRAEGLEVALTLTTEDLWKLAEGVDLSAVVRLVPGLLEHNLARPEIREQILTEAEAALKLEGERSLTQILEPASLAHWRQRCVDVTAPLLGELLASDAFTEWMSSGA